MIKVLWIDNYPFFGTPSLFTYLRWKIAERINKDKEFKISRHMRNPDVTIVVKRMEPDLKIPKGSKLIFDTNVNYFTRTGDFIVPGTMPTDDHMKNARTMAQKADKVIVTSTSIRCSLLERAEVIKDPIEIDIYRPKFAGEGLRAGDERLRLIWCGIRKKAKHLELIEDVLYNNKDRISLKIVTDGEASNNPTPPVLERLVKNLGAEVLRYSYKNLAYHFRESDVVISPKILNNSYEMGHTEHKITCGMACGLLAIASPQPSYLEAAENGGVTICESDDEWGEAISMYLNGGGIRLIMDSIKAKKNAVGNYSLEEISEQYKKAILETANG